MDLFGGIVKLKDGIYLFKLSGNIYIISNVRKTKHMNVEYLVASMEHENCSFTNVLVTKQDVKNLFRIGEL